MRTTLRRILTVSLLIPAGLAFVSGVALAATPAEDLAGVARHVTDALDRLDAGDLAGARVSYMAFEDGWFDIEDGIREQSKESYRAIEDAMGAARYALQSEPFDAAKAREALRVLQGQARAFIEGGSAMPQASGADVSQGPVTLSSVVARLDQALVLIEAGDALGAAAQVDAFRREWIEVEGLVKTKSSQVYADTENRMAEAYALLSRQPADLAGAWETISQMKADLAPFAQGDTYYGVFDAAIILLREGLEALLVVGALLAFLRKVGQGDKGRWIWAGGGAGVLASVLVAVIVNVAFSQAVSGENRELLEGATGLAAAAMLLYVSYWLHSKASLGAWQKYISGRTSAALARNSLLSLAVIAFLAVFREGAETVLFYIGIAPSIAARDLAVGVGVGILGLGILGVLMLTFGLRVPVRPFFLGTSLLIFYLAFKFIGTGVHALQVAGILGVTPASYLPASGVLGLFPVWETAAPQLVLLLAAGGVLLATQLRKSYPRGRPERVP